MLNARNWLATRIEAAAGITDESWGVVAGFALLWFLFEERICGTDADKDVLDAVARQYNAAALTTEMLAARAYWIDRYCAGGTTNARFDELFDRPSGKTEVAAVLLDPNPDLDRQVFALLMIAYRLRNNLFHGVKKIETLNEQSENLDRAAQTLASVMEQFGVK